MPSPLSIEIPRDERAPARARRAIGRLDGHLDATLREDVVLLVSELVSNGVKYGDGGPLQLEVQSRAPRHVRVEVVDQGGGFVPQARSRPAEEAGGWGLHLVERLADRWGVHQGSTHVWFEIAR